MPNVGLVGLEERGKSLLMRYQIQYQIIETLGASLFHNRSNLSLSLIHKAEE